MTTATVSSAEPAPATQGGRSLKSACVGFLTSITVTYAAAFLLSAL